MYDQSRNVNGLPNWTCFGDQGKRVGRVYGEEPECLGAGHFMTSGERVTRLAIRGITEHHQNPSQN